jgi:hypothetical protein
MHRAFFGPRTAHDKRFIVSLALESFRARIEDDDDNDY